MGAFIVSGLIVVATLLLSAFALVAEASGDTTGLHGAPVTMSIFCTGMGFAGLVLATHWMPSLGW